jgi:hypothetical protein
MGGQQQTTKKAGAERAHREDREKRESRDTRRTREKTKTTICKQIATWSKRSDGQVRAKMDCRARKREEVKSEREGDEVQTD